MYLFGLGVGLFRLRGFPCSSVGKESACNSGHLGSILGWEDPLEKEMATHSSVLAWRIPWTEEPGRLQSTGLQELGMTEWLSTHRGWSVFSAKGLIITILGFVTYRISVATTELCHCQGKMASRDYMQRMGMAGVSKTPAGGQVWSKENLSLWDRKAYIAYKVS